MMFSVELAVSLSKHFQAQALVDMGARHSYKSQSYLAPAKLPMQALNIRRSLAKGSMAVLLGKAVIPLSIQSYEGGTVECFVLPMSDIILGEDWCEQTSFEVSYKTHIVQLTTM